MKYILLCTQTNEIACLFRAGQNFIEMREELDFKEDEFDKAKYTSEMIEYRNEALRKQLENVLLMF
jgi:hypothetical protein